MEPTNPFNRTAEQYSRDLDIRRAYVEQTAIYLSKSTGVEMDECRVFVIQELQSQMKDPLVCVLERDEEGDRSKKAYPFTQYLDYVIKNRYYIAPTLSVVLPPWIRESKLSKYIKGNLADRNEEKHKQMIAKNRGDAFKATLHKNNQNNKKILNNAISGNHRSEHSHLVDRPTHPILTSSCRIANGVANSHNERFLAGNRHYYSPEVVINNFASILDLTDFTMVRDACEHHRLHMPSPDEVMQMVERSIEPYWSGRVGLVNIERFVRNMEPEERAAVMYMGDFYHLRLYNEELVRTWIDRLSCRASRIVPDHEDWLKKVDGDIINQVKVIYPDILGREELDNPELRNDPNFGLIGSSCYEITQCLHDHRRIIDAFHTTRNIPFLIADFPSSIRKVTVGSDTDSAIFTVQDWVRWYSGNDTINHANIIVAETFGFLISQTTTHNLATMVSNIGVTDPKELFRLSMKNEYLFPVFVLTSRAKHYFANMAVQEGVIFKEYDFERKGVELIASNLPPVIRKDLDGVLHYIIDSVTNDEPVSIHKILRMVARWEYTVMESVMSGETDYLKTARVNEEEGYSTENSRFINYEMWQRVFAPNYGACEPPPYSALSFSITPDTKRKTEQWISTWSNRTAADEMTAWLASRGKSYVGEMLLPEAIILSVGIPKEVLPVIDVRKIVAKAMSPFYLVLESLEFYCFDEKQSKLVMDMVTRDEAFMLDS
ncbi:hypothetical protein [Erwinia phage vB_Ea277G]|nr:hypothetical protein [Erwinia phage vB_Ea277G]